MTFAVGIVGHNCGLVITTTKTYRKCIAIDTTLRFFANCFFSFAKFF